MSEVKQFASNAGAGNKQSGRSKVSYPYFDADASLEVARLLHVKGGGSATPDQMAAFLGYKSVKSGTYQTRTSAARQFGFIRYENGTIAVTERAHKILNPVMPDDASYAKAEAFLSIELFDEIYKKFQGQTIPPEVGMKNLLIQTFGFSSDRAGPAVRVLMDSAEQCGFFSASGDRSRLIKPAIKTIGEKHVAHEQSQQKPLEEKSRQSPSGGGEPPGVHSAIIGLLRELPAPGSPWTKSKKKAFKAAFSATLDFIYPTDEEDDSEGESDD